MNTTNNIPTDSPQKITVESQIIYALWSQGRAYAGFAAEFEVKTLLVGDGAKVKATLYTAKGKKLDKVEGVMVLNRWRGKVVISDKVKPDDYVYLEVELPKHGLSIDSNEIPVRPPIEVSSMKWSKVQIHRDEEVQLSCVFTNGVEEGDEVSVIIYEYDNDGNHDTVVKIPTVIKDNKVELNWKFIYQEDTDDIPTDEELKKYGKNYNPPEYFFVVMVDNVPVGRKQESGILEFKDWVEINLTPDPGFSAADATFTVYFADGTSKDGTTDDKGYAKLEDVPPGPCKVEIKEMKPLSAGSGSDTSGSSAGAGGAVDSSGGAGKTGDGSTAKSDKFKKKEPVFVERDGKKIPFFYQLDTEWSDETLGAKRTIGQAGCFVSSIAMILKFYGRDVTPKTLDAYLDKNSGYVGEAVYIDKALKFKENGGVTLSSNRVTTGFSSVLDEKIKKNIPTIARVKYGSSKSTAGDHFVVIVGKTSDGEYIMNDPGAANGNGTENPSSENIVGLTKRKSGYTIVRLDCIVEM
ncbi:MAG: C39 family peptidase [Chitinispirillaceae bacterium]|nr:C39 family peptidase [Chitinispirillaceae bacterium]